MKRVLAGVLTLVMLLCCMPAMAHAAGTDDQVKRYTVLGLTHRVLRMASYLLDFYITASHIFI